MTLPNCSSAYPMPDGNGFWCQRAGTVIEKCAPDCIHRRERPVATPAKIIGRFC